MKPVPKDQPLFRMAFINNKTSQRIRAQFFEPELQTAANSESWSCAFRISSGRRMIRRTSVGATWLQALLLAVESLHHRIPIDEADDWVNEAGIASWAIIPRTVPVSWGLPLYKELAEKIVAQEKAVIDGLAMRRRNRRS